MVTISRDTLLLTGGLALGAGIYYLLNKKEKERRESKSRQEMQEMMMQMAARRGSLQPGDRAMSYMDPQAAASQFKRVLFAEAATGTIRMYVSPLVRTWQT